MTGAASLVIAGGTVLTGPAWVPAPRDVLVRDGTIDAVGLPGDFGSADAACHDARGRLIFPGLINGHAHSHAAIARGVARDWTLEVSLVNGGWMSAARSAELARLGAELAAAELIASGCTGVFDLVAQAGGPSPEGLYAVARGYQRAGLRAVVAPMVSDRTVFEAIPALEGWCAPADGPNADAILATCLDFIERWPAGLMRVSPALAPTIAAHCTPELITGLHRIAVQRGLRMHTHLAESKPQAIAGAGRFGHSITAELRRLGILDERLTVAHAIWVSDADQVMLGDAGTVAVTVPSSNLRLGSGIADARGLLNAGVRLAVGTDGANSADRLDMLDATRLASLMSHVTARPAAEWLTVREALDAATTGGAAACGWPGSGRIAPGYAADLVFADLRAVGFVPQNDLSNQLITAARAGDITDVMIGGQFVYADRACLGIDRDAVIDRILELTEEFQVMTADARAQAAEAAAFIAADLAAERAKPWPVDRLAR